MAASRARRQTALFLRSREARRAVAVLLSIAYFAANALVLLFVILLADFFEHEDPTSNSGSHWPIVVLGGMTALALVVMVAITVRRYWLALGAFAIDLITGFVLLYWALGDSRHSDGKLLVLGFFIEATGLAAVGLAISEP